MFLRYPASLVCFKMARSSSAHTIYSVVRLVCFGSNIDIKSSQVADQVRKTRVNMNTSTEYTDCLVQPWRGVFWKSAPTTEPEPHIGNDMRGRARRCQQKKVAS